MSRAFLALSFGCGAAETCSEGGGTHGHMGMRKNYTQLEVMLDKAGWLCYYNGEE